ncbi:peptidylprolyl isomerase [bacterium]|nr:peptidylprolyl isomerase [bacterium]
MRKSKISTGLIWIVSGVLLVMGLVVVNGCGRKKEELIEEGTRENTAEIIPLEEGGKKMIVTKGDKVKIEYIGSFEDGTIFDRSKEGSPLVFEVGSRRIIPGLERGVKGMKLNEEKKIEINVNDAYGPRREDIVRSMPRTSFPPDLQVEKGKVLRLKDKEGRLIMGKILEIKGDDLVVDFNHPLAGKNLVFEVKVVGIE